MKTSIKTIGILTSGGDAPGLNATIRALCISAKENGNSINIEIEKELGVEIVGDTKVKIAIEEDEDVWDILDDDYDEKIDDESNNIVKEDFIKEEK